MTGYFKAALRLFSGGNIVKLWCSGVIVRVEVAATIFVAVSRAVSVQIQ